MRVICAAASGPRKTVQQAAAATAQGGEGIAGNHVAVTAMQMKATARRRSRSAQTGIPMIGSHDRVS
jgi:hypothetical protein